MVPSQRICFHLGQMGVDPLDSQGEGVGQGLLIQLEEIQTEPGRVVHIQKLKQTLLHDEGPHVNRATNCHLR